MKKRKSFILFTEWFDAINDLNDSEQAELFRNLFIYHQDNSVKIRLSTLPTKLVWKLIHPHLLRNKDKYDARSTTSKDNGKLGGRPKNLTNLKNKPNKPIVTLYDNVNVNVNKDKIKFLALLDFINSTLGKKYKVFSDSNKKKYLARIKDGYSKNDIQTAITNASKDDYHKETNFKYLTIEYFSRSNTLDRFCSKAEVKKIYKPIIKQRYV